VSPPITCVVVCVVTVSSLSESAHIARSRSGIRAKQQKSRKRPYSLTLCITWTCSVAFGNGGKAGIRNEEVSGSIPLSSTIYSIEEILISPKASVNAGFFTLYRPVIVHWVH
jgi:hypothetical protein